MRKDLISKIMSEMGRKGGLVGGKRSAESLTPEQRTDRARKAAAASAAVRSAKAAKRKEEQQP